MTFLIVTDKHDVFKIKEIPVNRVDMNNGEQEDHVLCVLIPFRDRFEDLLEFVPSISKFLSKMSCYWS